MPFPIRFSEQENAMLQSIFRTIYEDDRIRFYEGPIILGILNKLTEWPTPPGWTEQEQRRVQYQLEKFIELLKPYPYPYSPLTFGQDTRQLTLIERSLEKIEAAWD